MGCPQYQPDERDDYLETASGKRALKRFQEAEEELQAGRKNKAHSFKTPRAGTTVRRSQIG
jgi:hypothetical protein